MNASVYPPELFALRRTIRMHAHAGPTTTHQAERIALTAHAARHSVAYSLASAVRYLRSVRQRVPPPTGVA